MQLIISNCNQTTRSETEGRRFKSLLFRIRWSNDTFLQPFLFKVMCCSAVQKPFPLRKAGAEWFLMILMMQIQPAWFCWIILMVAIRFNAEIFRYNWKIIRYNSSLIVAERTTIHLWFLKHYIWASYRNSSYCFYSFANGHLHQLRKISLFFQNRNWCRITTSSFVHLKKHTLACTAMRRKMKWMLFSRIPKTTSGKKWQKNSSISCWCPWLSRLGVGIQSGSARIKPMTATLFTITIYSRSNFIL